MRFIQPLEIPASIPETSSSTSIARFITVLCVELQKVLIGSTPYWSANLIMSNECNLHTMLDNYQFD